MRTRTLLAATLLLALAAAPALAAEGAPASVRYALPGEHGSSVVSRGVTVCLDVETGFPSASWGGACILSAPAASTITIAVVQDPGLPALYRYEGFGADGLPCGLADHGFGEETFAWDPACVTVGVTVWDNGYTGTIHVS